MKDKVKTSIKFDSDLWIQVKITAAKRRITITEFVEEALRDKLSKEAEK